jgi:hypothetical protein
MLRRIFGPKKDELTDSGENYIMSLIIYALHHCSDDQIEKDEMGGACSTYREWRGVYTVLVVKHEGSDHLEDPGVNGRIILKLIYRKWDVVAWTGLIWLRIGTGGGHLLSEAMSLRVH